MKLIILTCIFLGLILGIRYAFYFQYHKDYSPGDSFRKQVILLSEPKISEFSQSFRVEGLIIQTDKYPQFHYGNSLKIEGRVATDTFESGGKTITILVVNKPGITVLPTSPFIQTASFIRTRIQNTFDSYLPKNESALLFGIVFGGTHGFSPRLQDAFRNSGVLHVVAASGMNVTMVAGFLIAVFERLFKRKTALVLTISGVFYYALLSGFSPSIIRASIMAAVAFSAGILGKQNYSFMALVLAVFIMLIISPGTLFDAGFLLSFTSTLGILIFKPWFDSIKMIQKTKGISDDLGTTVSAQIGSMPVMASLFGAYSYISIFVNALVLWTIPFLMVLGGIAALCAITLPFVSVIFLYLSYPLLLYFETIVTIFGRLPMLRVNFLPISVIAGYYLILAGIALFLNDKSRKRNLGIHGEGK